MAPVIPSAHQRRGKKTRGRETGGKEEDQREREREKRKRKEERKEKSCCVSKPVSTRASLLPTDESPSALQPPLGTSPALPCLHYTWHAHMFSPGQLGMCAQEHSTVVQVIIAENNYTLAGQACLSRLLLLGGQKPMRHSIICLCQAHSWCPCTH